MGITQRRAKKQATRRDVKNAAMRVFESVGFDGASVARITREAGVAQGTFYVHFESKDALLDELLEDFNRAIAAELAPLWADVAPAQLDDAVRRTAEVFLDFWFARRAFVDAYARRTLARPDVGQLADGFSPDLPALLAVGLGRLAATLGTPLPAAELAAHGLLGMWLRVVLQYVFHTEVTRPEAVRALRAMTTGALRGLLPALSSSRKESP